jgi:hypothetical protein
MPRNVALVNTFGGDPVHFALGDLLAQANTSPGLNGMGECYRGVHGGRPVARRLPQNFGEVRFDSGQQAHVLQGRNHLRRRRQQRCR